LEPTITGSSQTIEHIVREEKLLLLPEKAIYWSDKKILFVSDLHLGKIDHFRKEGIAVPFAARKTNLEKLAYLLQNHKVNQCIFLGDLFHSLYNQSATKRVCKTPYGGTRIPRISSFLLDAHPR